MRSSREIQFRLRQEAANLYLALRPPAIDRAIHAVSKTPLDFLPPPAPVAARLRDSAFAGEVERIARGILDHRVPLLGLELRFTGPIPWRKDWLHEREFPGAPFFRTVPYLNFERSGDHKIVWELNRHQHFVLLAQAHLLTGQREFFDALVSHWNHWVVENPFQRGINWTSALEVAFRALSWMWVYHLAGSQMEEPLRKRFLTELYRHGCHLEYNRSIYFSPNTHLLGEAVALHALGVLFEDTPRAARWRDMGAQTVQAEVQRQVQADGSHFEQSTYYHVYALDFFLLHYVIAGRPKAFDVALTRMADYLDAVQGPSRRIPFIGDDDGGRLFHPYGSHDRYCRATLATCAALFHRPEWLNASEDLHTLAAWWLGASALDFAASPRPVHSSRLFPDSGTAVFESGDLFALADAGGFGPFRAGHSHSDTLSIVLRRGGQDILIDPGTYSYAEPEWRNWFRGSAAHTTVRVDQSDQARPLGSFAWAGKPVVRIRQWESSESRDYLDATCQYDGHPFTHRRRLLFEKHRGWLLILDQVDGSGGGRHLVEQFWNCGCPVVELGPHAFQLGNPAAMRLLLDETMECRSDQGWHSPAYGVKLPGHLVVAQRRTALPVLFAAALVDRSCEARAVKLQQDGSRFSIVVGDCTVCFPDSLAFADGKS